MSAASNLSRELARHAECVCRHYLPAGIRQGRYWTVGDVLGLPGGSLYVRIRGSDHGKGAAGKWADSATGAHGDLLDLIGLNRSLTSLTDAMDEARSFLALPQSAGRAVVDDTAAPPGSPIAARRLFAASRPIAATLAERYLHSRGINGVRSERWLRFHDRCWYRRSALDPADTPAAMPALIAAVTGRRVARSWVCSGPG